MSNSILSETLERAGHWSIEVQAELAAYAAEIQAGLWGDLSLPSADELAGIDRGLADADAGRFEPADAVDRIFARYRRT